MSSERKALEAVAWMLRHRCDGNVWLFSRREHALEEQRSCHDLIPLYASPPASVTPAPVDGAVEALRDKIEGLTADLDSAVETAFERGAYEWTRLNYPDHYKRLASLRSTGPSEPVTGQSGVTEELWALCYLHDWDPPKEGQEHRWEPGKNVFPQVHAFYHSWQVAEAIRRTMKQPERYWVLRARPESEARLTASIGTPSGWRSMDSAPKDGTRIIALENGMIYFCRWLIEEPDEGPGHEGWWDESNSSFENPTHWVPMMLPPLPSAPEGGE